MLLVTSLLICFRTVDFHGEMTIQFHMAEDIDTNESRKSRTLLRSLSCGVLSEER